MAYENIDAHGRTVDYLRISITDRCNLRCIYCMPEEGVPRLSHEDVLSYEEIIRILNVAGSIGISKVRVTGGEPLVRKGVVEFCRSLVEIVGRGCVSITTNGVLLEEFAWDLWNAGIRRINVSLDTLKRERFAEITRRDYFNRVWNGIMTAYRIGFHPVKLNVVVIKGLNDDEIEDLAALTFEYPFHVRFIEFMPFGSGEWSSRFVSSDEIVERLKNVGELLPAVSLNSNGPAKYYAFRGALGKVGIISPISHHFCATCNRLRLTADGKLRTCLFATKETDLRAILRSSEDDEKLKEAIVRALKEKPEKHGLNEELFHKCIGRPMIKIGG
ncbi:GTP 3',8-cyclase MoaA [Thermodesulforhabdus norvegica]|uniref:GTP 3',8-cyclase n=1 Tax=Thermodesulforhabdus norvegica TaxID=39841 RepID=A0A1I4SS80_9BACT|nr:GTP 3',8-cyclase MoaA [Thermodesulforhabdus norvegica]SFM67292.1 cyclic pyranopterin monophosphate synthase subunit MoaA [Thermodesulforhabdus norvegica]